ncbi:hypothetical protein [uncultured Algibacter sp.]|uniref:hypothetical protein n=1 Tax=uncultured Algibacter sp. TaxID=298659 RepID=UPI0026379BAE|nr:hypothetical protein [uncultured Algibacter sp.]
MIGSEFKLDHRDIAPSGKIEIREGISISSIDLKNLNKFSLTASYEVAIADGLKKHHTTFVFLIPMKDIAIKTYLYNDVKRQEGIISKEEIKKNLGYRMA